MRNVIKGTHAGKEYFIPWNAVSQVVFNRDEESGKTLGAELYYIGEEDTVQNISDPFVLAQLEAYAETISNTFALKLGDKLAHFPFASVSVVIYDNSMEPGQESAQVVLNSGMTFGLDVSETETFRMNYGKWIDRKGI